MEIKTGDATETLGYFLGLSLEQQKAMAEKHELFFKQYLEDVFEHENESNVPENRLFEKIVECSDSIEEALVAVYYLKSATEDLLKNFLKHSLHKLL